MQSTTETKATSAAVTKEAAPQKEKVFVHALRSILASIPKRSQDILEARFGISHHRTKTLEEIGQEYSITRERVRQIICSALHALVRHHEQQSEGGHIEALVQAELHRHSGVLETSILINELSQGDREEKGALTAFLECLPYARSEKAGELHEKISFLPQFSYDTWKEVVVGAKEVLVVAGHPLSAKQLFKKFTEAHGDALSEKEFFDFLAVSSEVKSNVFGKWGLASWSDIQPRGTREKAYLVLKNHKSPMHFRDIALHIDESGLRSKRTHSHPQTVHNELIKDKRFVLVGRGTYALTDWGYKAGTVKEVITDVLREAGKPLAKQEVVDAVLKMRQVKVTTIAINLNSFFVKDAEGRFSLKK
jgi:hypothetical protein